MLHVYAAAREYILCGFAQQETQRTAIYSHSAGFAAIDELNVFALVYFEFQTLGYVVDLGGNDRVRLFEFEIGQHLQERSPFRILPVGAGILAIDLQHDGMWVFW
jgi:hypothetical protein